MKKRKVDQVESPQRVVIHVDLDCFYVQVERNINPQLIGKPVVVVQYNPFGDLKSLGPLDNRLVKSGSAIAVSYEARAKGVKRSMRGVDAKAACPELLQVQVPTSHGKADLKIYRDASSKIVSVLGSRYPSCILERASIDEVYLDVTVEAVKMLDQSDVAFLSESIESLLAVPTLIAGEDSKEVNLSRSQISRGHDGTYTAQNDSGSSAPVDSTEHKPLHQSWFSRPLHTWSVEDKLLLCGAIIARNLRKDVLDQLGFTCSGGVAHNKMLAKLASAMHKPNKQTVVPLGVIPTMMQSLPMSRIQGLGGKLGQAVTEQFGDRIKTMGDLLRTDRQELVGRFGEESTQWMLDAARGVHHEPVQDRALPVSIGCSKSYRSQNKLTPENLTDGVILKWYGELAMELHDRVQSDTDSNSRVPRNLHIGLSVVPHDEAAERIKEERRAASGATNGGRPPPPADPAASWWSEAGFSLCKIVPMVTVGGPEAIARTALSAISRALAEHPRMATPSYLRGEYRITSLSLGAANFRAVESGAGAITSFFKAGVATAAPAAAVAATTSGGTEDTSTTVAVDIDNMTPVKPANIATSATQRAKPTIAAFFKDSSSSSTDANPHGTDGLFNPVVMRLPAVGTQNSAGSSKRKGGISTFFTSAGITERRDIITVADDDDDDDEGTGSREVWESYEDFQEIDVEAEAADGAVDSEPGGVSAATAKSTAVPVAVDHSSDRAAAGTIACAASDDAMTVKPSVVTTPVATSASTSAGPSAHHQQRLALLAQQGVDAAVFDALPVDIQSELLRSFQQPTAGNRSSSNINGNNSSSRNVTKSRVGAAVNGGNPKNGVHKFFGMQTIKEK